MDKLNAYTLENKNNVSIRFLNYGGIVTHILAPDKKGEFANIVLGFDDDEEYLRNNPAYYGALVGRYANRLADASFTLNEKKYVLAKNDGLNSLHGGLRGFSKVFWDVEVRGPKAKLSYLSKDGEEGYPGNLKVEVSYSLNDKNEFLLDYRATTDQDTIINLTSHSYFNLSGLRGSTALDHALWIDSQKFTVSDSSYIPTGQIASVEGPTDFRSSKKIGQDIEKIHEGYNHNYILNHPDGKAVLARLTHEKSGRGVEVMTTEPGLQFYSGYFLEPKYAGMAMEAQHFPDSPHHQNFPTTVLRAGETYTQQTTYRLIVI